jgi:hypothetical protein
MNKSKRQWKIGVSRTPNKNWRNRGSTLSWEQKTEIKKEKDKMKAQIKEFK